MPQWPAAVLFDFDGVLVNSEPLHFQAFRNVLQSAKIELTEEEYYGELIGFDDRGAIRHVYSKRQLDLPPKDFLALMAGKKRAMQSLIRKKQFAALPGVEEFVRGLWRHYPLAICSGALREEIEAMLEGISLRDCFPIIVAAEDVTVGKPDPQGYLLTLKLLGEKAGRALRPEESLIVEDAPTVIRSVKTVGFKVLGVAGSYSLDKLTDADWAVPSLQPDTVSKALPHLKLGAI